MFPSDQFCKEKFAVFRSALQFRCNKMPQSLTSSVTLLIVFSFFFFCPKAAGKKNRRKQKPALFLFFKAEQMRQSSDVGGVFFLLICRMFFWSVVITASTALSSRGDQVGEKHPFQEQPCHSEINRRLPRSPFPSGSPS